MHDDEHDSTGVAPTRRSSHLPRRTRGGRVLLAIAFGAFIGALAGFGTATPRYEAVGRIQVAPHIDLLLDQSGEEPLHRTFGAFLNMQAAAAQSHRVASRALDRADNARTLQGWPEGAEGLRLLSSAMRVSVHEDTASFSIGVTHQDPRLAQAAAKAVTDAYMELYGQLPAKEMETKKNELKALQMRFEAHLLAIQSQRQAVLANSGFRTDNLEHLEQRYVDLVFDLERALARVEAQIVVERAARAAEVNEGDSATSGEDEELELERSMIENQLADAADDLERIVRTRQQLRSLNDDADEVKTSLDMIKDELAPIEANMDRLRRRITIVEEPFVPLEPISERHWRRTLVGGLVGAGVLTLSLLVLAGLRRRT